MQQVTIQNGSTIPFILKAGEYIKITTSSLGAGTVAVPGESIADTLVASTEYAYGKFSAQREVIVRLTDGSADVEIDSGAPTVTKTRDTTSTTGKQLLDTSSRRALDSTLYKRAPKLRKWYTAVARVMSGQGQAYIGLFDDSTGLGAGAGSSGTTNMIGAAPYSPTAQFVSWLNSQGIPAADNAFFGEGLFQAFGPSITPAQYDSRFAYAGTASYFPNGNQQSLRGIMLQIDAAGEGLSFTPKIAGSNSNVDTAKIISCNRYTGTWDSNFNGGASLGTVTGSGASTLAITTKSFTRGTGPFNITWSSGNNVFVGGIFTDSTTPRVNVLNFSSYGDKLTIASGVVNNPNEWRGGLAMAALALDACIVGMTINSENQDGIAGVAAYKAALIKLCNDVVNSGADLILKTPHAIGTAPQTNGITDAYIQAIREVAAQFDAPIIDMYQRMDNYTAFNALTMYDDTLHLKKPGYFATAMEYARVLNCWA